MAVPLAKQVAPALPLSGCNRGGDQGPGSSGSDSSSSGCGSRGYQHHGSGSDNCYADSYGTTAPAWGLGRQLLKAWLQPTPPLG